MILSYVANYEIIIPIMCVSAPKKPHMQKPDKPPLTLSGFFFGYKKAGLLRLCVLCAGSVSDPFQKFYQCIYLFRIYRQHFTG